MRACVHPCMGPSVHGLVHACVRPSIHACICLCMRPSVHLLPSLISWPLLLCLTATWGSQARVLSSLHCIQPLCRGPHPFSWPYMKPCKPSPFSLSGPGMPMSSKPCSSRFLASLGGLIAQAHPLLRPLPNQVLRESGRYYSEYFSSVSSPPLAGQHCCLPVSGPGSLFLAL